MFLAKCAHSSGGDAPSQAGAPSPAGAALHMARFPKSCQIGGIGFYSALASYPEGRLPHAASNDPCPHLGGDRQAGRASRPEHFRACPGGGAGPDFLQQIQALHPCRTAALARHGKPFTRAGGDRRGPRRISDAGRGWRDGRRTYASRAADRICAGRSRRVFRRCGISGGRQLGRDRLSRHRRPQCLCAGNLRRQHGTGLPGRRHHHRVAQCLCPARRPRGGQNRRRSGSGKGLGAPHAGRDRASVAQPGL